MTDKIQTLHPDPRKQGVNIERGKYDIVREAIISAISERGEMTFTELNKAVKAKLTDQFDGSIAWYTTTVKLDLEARQLIERIPGKKPQHLRLRQE